MQLGYITCNKRNGQVELFFFFGSPVDLIRRVLDLPNEFLGFERVFKQPGFCCNQVTWYFYLHVRRHIVIHELFCIKCFLALGLHVFKPALGSRINVSPFFRAHLAFSGRVNDFLGKWLL